MEKPLGFMSRTLMAAEKRYSQLDKEGLAVIFDTNDQVLMMNLMDDSPVSAVQIRKWTSHDITLSKVHEYMLKGWPEEIEPPLLPYYYRRDSLYQRWMCYLGSKNHHTITRSSYYIETDTSDPFWYVKNEGIGPFIHVVAWYGSGCGKSGAGLWGVSKFPAQAPFTQGSP